MHNLWINIDIIMIFCNIIIIILNGVLNYEQYSLYILKGPDLHRWFYKIGVPEKLPHFVTYVISNWLKLKTAEGDEKSLYRYHWQIKSKYKNKYKYWVLNNFPNY